MTFGCGCTWGDPGPCPVDDTPHRACVSPDYDPKASIVVPIGTADRHVTVAVTAPTATGFTTKTYRRAIHGRPR